MCVSYLTHISTSIYNKDYGSALHTLGFLESIIRNQSNLDEVIADQRGNAFTHPIYKNED